MARPRFAPVGSRANVSIPRYVPGQTRLPRFVPGQTVLPRISQPEPASTAVDELRSMLDRGADDFEIVQAAKRMNLAPEEWELAAPILREAQRRGRPSTALTVVGRVLGVGESTIAGIASGVMREQDAANRRFQLVLDYKQEAEADPGSKRSRDLLRQIEKLDDAPPWMIVNAFAEGFSEVPEAVIEGYTFNDLIREQANPDSFLSRHATPIGFTMSIFFDPLTYLSFGATTASKKAALGLMGDMGRDAAKEAERRLAAGAINPRTGMRYLEHERREAVFDVLLEKGAPKTLGDAMKLVRNQELALKAEYRAGRGQEIYLEGMRDMGWKALADVKSQRRIRGGIRRERKRIAGALLPTNVKGGRGVRFGGVEIPGTPQLGEYLARRFRETGTAQRDLRLYQAIESVIPNAAARHIVDDWTRAMALSEISRFKDTAQAAVKISTDVPASLLSTNVYDAPAVAAERNLVGTVGGILTPAQRRDLLRREGALADPKDAPDVRHAKKTLVDTINQRVGSMISQGVKHGADEVRLRAKWETFKGAHSDPLVALSKFVFHQQGRLLQRQFISHILDDPRFAFPLKSGRKEDDTRLLTPPEGYDVVDWGNKRYAVVDSIAEAIDGFRNEAVLHSSLEKALYAANFTQNWWKIYATTPNPAFHVMNFLGAVWNNFLAGIYNPVDYVDALGTLYRARLEGAAERGQKRLIAPGQLGRVAKGEGLRRVVPESTELGREAQRIVGEAEIRGGLGRSSFIFADTEHLAGAGPQTTTTGPRRFFEQPVEFEGKRAAGARTVARRARQVASPAAVPLLGPLALVGLAPEAARAGRAVGGAIEDLVRLTPFMKAARDPAVQRVLEAFGPVRVPGLRYPNMTKAHQTAMYNIGAEMSRHFQFDYTDLTFTERYLAKTLFPFYTYYRKNFVLQAGELIKQPRKVETTMAAMNYIDSEGEDLGPWKALLPEYFDNLQAFQIPVPAWLRERMGLPKDQPLYLNPKLPFVSINLFPPLWQMFQDPATPTWQKLGAVIAPVAGSIGPHAGFPGSKIMLEAVVGKQLGLNRPIDFQRANSNDWRQSYVPAPGWARYLPKALRDFVGVVKTKRGPYMMPATHNYVLQQLSTPFVSNFGSAIPIGADPADEARARADMVSWMTGIRLMPVDMHKLHKNYAYRLKNMLEAKQSDLRERGLELPDEDRILLADVRDAVEVIRDIEEIRAEELGYANP